MTEQCRFPRTIWSILVLTESTSRRSCSSDSTVHCRNSEQTRKDSTVNKLKLIFRLLEIPRSHRNILHILRSFTIRDILIRKDYKLLISVGGSGASHIPCNMTSNLLAQTVHISRFDALKYRQFIK